MALPCCYLTCLFSYFELLIVHKKKQNINLIFQHNYAIPGSLVDIMETQMAWLSSGLMWSLMMLKLKAAQ